MTEQEQKQLLEDLVHDIEKSPGCKVGWYLCSKKNRRGFHIKVLDPPPSRSSGTNVFANGTTTARKGCLQVGTWEKYLANASWGRMSNWKKVTEYTEPGVAWELWHGHDNIYHEALYALSIACQHCLL